MLVFDVRVVCSVSATTVVAHVIVVRFVLATLAGRYHARGWEARVVRAHRMVAVRAWVGSLTVRHGQYHVQVRAEYAEWQRCVVISLKVLILVLARLKLGIDEPQQMVHLFERSVRVFV